MNPVLRLALAAVACFILSALVAPPILKITRRLRAGQPILHYVQEHATKQGTPTMGGWIFILPAAAITLCLATPMGVGYVAVFAMLAYAIVGFLDDYLKIRRADNGGLKPYQKIVAQLGIAVLLGVYVYRNPDIGTQMALPFADKTWEVGLWIIPIVVFVFLSGTNSVNLTDGLDGLAGGVTFAFCVGIATMLLISAFASPDLATTDTDLAVLAAGLGGSLLCFLLFNLSPARIFMGDTGSMALGGAVCCLTVFSRLTLYLPILGIIYVLSSISVIVQVGYFKLSKGKRLLRMAPMHHHLQRMGYSESQIGGLYFAITCLMAIVAIVGVYIGFYGVAN